MKRSKSGVDYSVRGGQKKGNKKAADLVLMIDDKVSWTNIKVSYLISSRNDFWLGSFIADTFDILDCTPKDSNNNFEASTSIHKWEPTNDKAQVLVFISGLRTEDYSFSA